MPRSFTFGSLRSSKLDVVLGAMVAAATLAALGIGGASCGSEDNPAGGARDEAGTGGACIMAGGSCASAACCTDSVCCAGTCTVTCVR